MAVLIAAKGTRLIISPSRIIDAGMILTLSESRSRNISEHEITMLDAEAVNVAQNFPSGFMTVCKRKRRPDNPKNPQPIFTRISSHSFLNMHTLINILSAAEL